MFILLLLSRYIISLLEEYNQLEVVIFTIISFFFWLLSIHVYKKKLREINKKKKYLIVRYITTGLHLPFWFLFILYSIIGGKIMANFMGCTICQRCGWYLGW